MYVFIKNLSPAQLSNDNPDVWRIQMPKREDLNVVKESDKLFVLLGYDYARKVYTSWNPYWCKQRINVAESCSMYSRLSLQKRVALSQKIEKLQLQNDGDVVCIPRLLLGPYLKNIRDYYPEESLYIPVGSSIQKRQKEERENNGCEKQKSPTHEELFEQFIACYDVDAYNKFLEDKGFGHDVISIYSGRLSSFITLKLLEKHKDLFTEFDSLADYRRAINRFCWQSDFNTFDDDWHIAAQAALKQYLLYAELHITGKITIRVRMTKEQKSLQAQTFNQEKTLFDDEVKYELDAYGKLKDLDNTIMGQTEPLVRDIDYPDWTEVIKHVKAYYPSKATEKMTPADWMKLFERVSWSQKKKRKALRITTLEGMLIERENATETFLEAIEHNYPDLIAEIPFGHKFIFTQEELAQTPNRDKMNVHLLKGGLYVNVKYSTRAKADILQRISDELDLNWTVEII